MEGIDFEHSLNKMHFSNNFWIFIFQGSGFKLALNAVFLKVTDDLVHGFFRIYRIDQRRDRINELYTALRNKITFFTLNLLIFDKRRSKIK